MKILVLNCGSSSIKYQLLDMQDESVLARGLVDRIGIPGSVLRHQNGSREHVLEADVPDHEAGVAQVINLLADPEWGAVRDIGEIRAVGHRTVHGGERFQGSSLVDEEVLETLRELSNLAPLHNPPQIRGIEAIRTVLPETPNVCTFDTAFHTTMPPEAYTYALPYEYYQKYGIRKYGFHGHSHHYVSERAAGILGTAREHLRIITCHLGNGASLAAVDRGVSVDTSMGFTPLAGLVMGTRCGDIDPAIVPFLAEREELDPAGMDSLLNKKSGVLGISGVSNDLRDIEKEAESGNPRARLALDVYCYRIRLYIGQFAAAMDGVDAIVFTAGVGENAVGIRAAILEKLRFLGVRLDPRANEVRGREAVISAPDSAVQVLVVPTNEELVIAREAVRLLQQD